MSKKFAKGMLKMTVIVSAVLAAVFLASVLLMIFAPQIFLSVLWYIIIGAGTLFALYLVICLAKHVIITLKQNRIKDFDNI